MPVITIKRTNKILVSELRVANHFFTRLKGLMLSKNLPKGHGLWISPCKQIHTHFMRYPIDVIFLNAELKVLDYKIGLKAWKFSAYYSEGESVLELPAFTINDIEIGDQLTIS